jgi:protease I
MELQDRKIAILAADMYEDLELWYPYYRMKEAGADVRLVGTASSADVVQSKHGYPAKIDLRADKANPNEFDAVIVPGGYGPDKLRMCKKTLDFVKKIFDAHKVTAAICHGGWVLISAGILRGRRATSYIAIKDDMKNAGADWIDEEVVQAGTLITSRTPADLPAFCKKIIEIMSS